MAGRGRRPRSAIRSAGRSTARWLRSDDGRRAVVEMAEASGLSRLTPEERDPIGATTAGTGELLRAAIDAGVRHVTLGHRRERHDRRRPRAARRPRRWTRDLARRRARSRLRRRNPLLGPRRRGGDLRPAEGRDARTTSSRSTRATRPGPTSWRRGPGGTSARRRAPAPPAASGSRCSPARTGSGLRPATRRRAADGGDRLRGPAGAGRPRHHRRGPDRRPDRRSARPRSGSRGGPRRPACRASRSAAASRSRGSRRWRPSARSRCRSSSVRRPSRRRWPPGPSRSSALVNGWRVWYHWPDGRHRDRRGHGRDRVAVSRRAKAQAKAQATEEAQVQRSRVELRQAARALSAGPAAVHARRARDALRPPGLGAPPRPDERADPDDPHPEHAPTRMPRSRSRRSGTPIRAWATVAGPPPGRGLGRRWACRTGSRRTGRPIEFAPLPELTDVIRPGGLANQKAPRLQSTLRRIREERGDYSLEFLGDLSAIEARDWLDQHRRDRQEDRLGAAAVLVRPAAPADRPPRRAGDAPRRPAAAEGDPRPGPRPRPRPVRARRDVRGPRQPHPARPQGLPRPATGPRRLPAPRRAAASSTRRRRRHVAGRRSIRMPRPVGTDGAFGRARTGATTSWAGAPPTG